jgi:3-hydroxy-9,10-secoandrosta-1,3,5(10)-triene-9,17-dione monooxygenase reductase component
MIDASEFRQVLGCFATGVAIVTTAGDNGDPVGMTVNSFNSVSLDPPLVLWSIDRESNCFDAFMSAEHFAVNVLGVHQQELSERFARRGVERFAGLDCRGGIGGAPVLPDYAACFECETRHRYDGGDHVILVGEVLAFEDRQSDPLIFFRGHYGV